MPTTVEDCSEVMSKQWAKDTFDSLEDFDPNNDLFFPLVLYANKTGTRESMVSTGTMDVHNTPSLKVHP
jgi:hypothetical protein